MSRIELGTAAAAAACWAWAWIHHHCADRARGRTDTKGDTCTDE